MRALILATTTLTLMACAPIGSVPDRAPRLTAQQRSAIAQAVAAPTRTAANRERDVWRHPVETLSFFGVRPIDHVVELVPGGGWYSEILIPLTANGGRYTAAGAWGAGLNGARRAAEALGNPAHVGYAEFPRAGSSANPAVAPGSADVVLTFRNVHNFRMRGEAPAADAFAQAFAMLKPGGRLGVVEHRLPESRPTAEEETSGYVKRSTVVRLAEAAGFRLVAESEINANPRDTANHPRGVWTLPPVLRGAADDAERARWRAIGESDRMTLLFIKPE